VVKGVVKGAEGRGGRAGVPVKKNHEKKEGEKKERIIRVPRCLYAVAELNESVSCKRITRVPITITVQGEGGGKQREKQGGKNTDLWREGQGHSRLTSWDAISGGSKSGRASLWKEIEEGETLEGRGRGGVGYYAGGNARAAFRTTEQTVLRHQIPGSRDLHI